MFSKSADASKPCLLAKCEMTKMMHHPHHLSKARTIAGILILSNSSVVSHVQPSEKIAFEID